MLVILAIFFLFSVRALSFGRGGVGAVRTDWASRGHPLTPRRATVLLALISEISPNIFFPTMIRLTTFSL